MSIIKYAFWPGIRFPDIDDLNEQARLWCDRLNQKMHRTTLRTPIDMWVEEQLQAWSLWNKRKPMAALSWGWTTAWID